MTGLIFDPLKAVAVNDNAYVNKKLGILFYKPQDWGFIAVKDFVELLKSEQIKVGKGLDEKKNNGRGRDMEPELGRPCLCSV